MRKSPFSDGGEVERRYCKLAGGSRPESLPRWHVSHTSEVWRQIRWCTAVHSSVGHIVISESLFSSLVCALCDSPFGHGPSQPTHTPLALLWLPAGQSWTQAPRSISRCAVPPPTAISQSINQSINQLNNGTLSIQYHEINLINIVISYTMPWRNINHLTK